MLGPMAAPLVPQAAFGVCGTRSGGGDIAWPCRRQCGDTALSPLATSWRRHHRHRRYQLAALRQLVCLGRTVTYGDSTTLRVVAAPGRRWRVSLLLSELSELT